MDECEQQSEPVTHGVLVYPTSRWRRFVFRLPLYAWRLGLGGVIGRRFLVLTATGRISGLPRRAVLEYTVMDGQLYIVSAWGERAQWYRNVLADPHVTVQTHIGAASMAARRVDDDAELTWLFERFQYSPVWDVYLDALCIERNAADFLAKRDRVHLLRLDSTDAPTLPSLEPDLKWAWWLVLVAGLVALTRRWARRRRASGGE